jgi:hypothetical protein
MNIKVYPFRLQALTSLLFQLFSFQNCYPREIEATKVLWQCIGVSCSSRTLFITQEKFVPSSFLLSHARGLSALSNNLHFLRFLQTPVAQHHVLWNG